MKIKYNLKGVFWAAVFLMLLAVTGPMCRFVYALDDSGEVITLAMTTPIITATSETAEYDGQPHYITATITDNLPLVITYYDADNFVVPQPTIPGIYLVDIRFDGNDSYYPAHKSVSLTITKAEFHTAVFQGLSLTYDGNIHSLIVTGIPADATVTYTNNDKINAGSYEVTAVISKPYYNTLVMTNMLVINKVVPVIAANNLDITYDGLPHYITASISHNLTLTKEYRNEAQEVVTNPTNAGKYTLMLNYAGDVNYNSVTKTVFLTIRPAQIVGVVLPDLTVTYDGSVHTLVATGIPSGATFSYNSTGYVNAGIYVIGVTVSKPNYSDYYTTGTLTIRRASLSGIVTFSNQTFVYDGGVKSLSVNGLPSSGVTVRYTRNTLTEVGSITAMAVVEGSNYETLTLYADLTITKAQAIISVLQPVFQFDYDGTLKEVSGTLNHSETELIYTAAKGYVNVGTYEITITALETANYLGASVTVSLIIRPIAITGITFENLTVVYDGTEQVLLAAGIPEGCVAVYTNNAHVGAGTYEARVLITKANYQNLELSATLTIEKAQPVITVNASSLNQVYDGTIKTVQAALNHGETGLSFSPAAGYVHAGTYVITVSCAESANYLGTSLEVTLVIHKAEAVIFAVLEQTFVYDGTAKHAVAFANHSEATVSMPEHINAGMYSDTITIAETANYLGASLTLTLIIDKATAFIDLIPIQNHTYDGTFKGVVAGLSHNETTLVYDPVTGYVNAGQYTINLSAPESANYQACSASVLLVITKAQGMIDAADVQEHTYDGAVKEIVAHLNHSEVELTYSPVSSYLEPGIYPILVHAAESENYLEVYKTVTLKIDKITAVITADAVQTFVYDKTMKEVVASLNHGETELVYSPFKGFIEAGQYVITVVAPETAHYQVAVGEVTLVINKAPSSITADAFQIFTYDGTMKEVTGTLSHEETGLLYSPQKGYVNADEYQITIFALESANYLSCQQEVTLRIEKADLAGIVFNGLDLFYDGLEHEILVANLPEGAQVLYTDNRSTDVCNLTSQALITKENYHDLVLTANLLIRQVTSVISAAPLQTFEYNEGPHEVLAWLNFAGTTLSFSPANAFTMIGEYDVTISVDETPNNTASSTVVHVVVVKGTPVITAASEVVTYDGLVHHVNASINFNLPLSVVYISSDAAIITDPVDADNYIVELTFAGNDCFNPVKKYITLTINKALLAGITLAAQSFTYDGDDHSLTLDAGNVEGLSIIMENNIQRAAGVHEVKATVSKPNYETLVLTSQLTISRKQLFITTVTASDRDYDGSLIVSLEGGVLEGLVESEDVTFELGLGLIENANVGNQKNVTVSIRLIGANASNYVLAQPSLKVNITKRLLQVNAPNLWKIADGSRKIDVPHVCLSGIVGNDEVHLSGNPSGQLVNPEPGNDIDVLLSGITLAGEDAGNYGLDFTGITGDVLLGNLRLSAEGTSLIITRCEGFDSQLSVQFTKVDNQDTFNQMRQSIAVLTKNTSLRAVYQVKADGVELKRPVKMELTIPEEYRDLSSLSLYHVTENGCEKVQVCRNGDILKFETSDFGYFVITSVPTISFFMMAAIIFSIIVLTIAIIYLITRYHQRLVKTN